MSSFPWAFLERGLTSAERSSVARDLEALVEWQRTLGAFPKLRAHVDATPFVSLYVRGRLAGCFGSDDARPRDRIARAFLRAMHDDRYGGIGEVDRREVVASVSYVRSPKVIEHDPKHVEPGVHGVAIDHPRGRTLILPQVAKLHAFDGKGMLTRLARKAGLETLEGGTLHAFEVEEVVAPRPARKPGDPRDLAAAWLARLIDGSGHVAFSVDARGKSTSFIGEYHHGRAAIVIRALAEHGKHARLVSRARGRLRADIEAAMRGEAVEGFCREPERIAGTLALAFLAGVEVKQELCRVVDENRERLARSAWYAAEVVSALGGPIELHRACVDDLRERPWAPWTAMAARKVGDRETFDRVAETLSGPLPRETALAAIVAEALVGSTHREALARAQAFVARQQLLEVPAHLDQALAYGAFPATPVNDLLRGDITGHALMALRAQ